MKKKAPIITCGIYLYNTKIKKILICHPTNSPFTKWSIPKGIKKVNENLFDAAVRELKEETGIDIKNIHIIKIIPLPLVKYQKRNKLLKPFLIITNSDIEDYPFHCIEHNPDAVKEIDDWLWVTPKNIKKFLHQTQQLNLLIINDLIRINERVLVS